MREIKFHGKRLDNGEWVVGYYWIEETRNHNKHHIYTFEKKGSTDLIRITGNFEVDPDTVGQYIGIKDRNGVEIYEGDIIQTYFSFSPGDAGYGVSQKPFVVNWEQGRSGFRAYKPNTRDWHLLDTVDFFEMQSKLYEVIGNIHDNPELLEVGHEL